MLVTIWAIACSPTPEEPTLVPPEVLRETLRTEVCDYIALTHEGDVIARRELNEWMNAHYWPQDDETRSNVFPETSSLWYIAHRYSFDPEFQPKDPTDLDRWRDIERDATTYFNALCVSPELNPDGDYIKGCIYWSSAAEEGMTIAAEGQLETAVEEGWMRGDLEAVTSIYLNAKLHSGYLGYLILDDRGVEERDAAEVVALIAFRIATTLCEEA